MSVDTMTALDRTPTVTGTLKAAAAPPSCTEDAAIAMAALSSKLVPIFCASFSDVLLCHRSVRHFAKDEILYEQGDRDRSFFFLRSGIVKTGTVTSAGREIIYDLRKDGDVVGELCVADTVRRDRAVALEPTDAIPASFDEVANCLAQHPDLLRDFVGVFCSALSEAHDQIGRLAIDSVVERLVHVLQALARKVGRPRGQFVEIATYLTQEELSQMVAARRERVSTGLNRLRQQGIAHYSSRGLLLLDTEALDRYADART